MYIWRLYHTVVSPALSISLRQVGRARPTVHTQLRAAARFDGGVVICQLTPENIHILLPPHELGSTNIHANSITPVRSEVGADLRWAYT